MLPSVAILLSRHPSVLASCAFVFIASACARPPCPAAPAATVALPGAPASTEPASTAVDGFYVLLRPEANPPTVHVAIEASSGVKTAGLWHLDRGSLDHLSRTEAHDDQGAIAVSWTADAGGMELRFSRVPSGTLHLSYDVAGAGDAPDDPFGTLVLEDRFRGSGGELVAIPDGARATAVNVEVHIDGGSLRAPGAASSLGVGSSRRASLAPGGLAHATFLAGSLGVAVMDDPGAGHDEGAWLGYTAFDPRTTVAELASIRSALHELFKDQPGDPWSYLVVSRARPVGSFSTTSRWRSTLLQVGPSESWNSALRLSMTQQLTRRWIGEQLAVETDVGHEAEGWWFSDGVARYVAMLALTQLGLLRPDEVREAVAGELSVVATSPHRGLDHAHLAELARKDPVARATLMARGALYALAESTHIRAHTKGQRGLLTAILSLAKVGDGERRRFSMAAWLAAIGMDDPDAGRTLSSFLGPGAPLLPADALGPCFRPQDGRYVAYDAGFDVEATRTSPSGVVVGLHADGPAAKAGLAQGDVVETMKAREGDASVKVELRVLRAGNRIALSYSPAGASGAGQTWARVPGWRDEACGSLP